MIISLPDLPYKYDALLPYMSPETLEYHHDKHHANYVINSNKLLSNYDTKEKNLEQIIKSSFNNNELLFNNISQHYNHLHFWQWMKKGGGGKKIPSKIINLINRDFNNYDKFRNDLINKGLANFGSGWVWVAIKNQKLKIINTKNAENPIINNAFPILGIDLWEHAYYIDYRNVRLKYLECFIDYLINWEYVLEIYESNNI